MEPSYAWGKVINVPNLKKGTNYYELRYNKDHHSPKENKFAPKVIGTKAVKEHLKIAFGFADSKGYCIDGIKRRKEKQMMATEATPLACPGTILIPDIIHKINIGSHAASVQSAGRRDNNSDDEKISDDRSNYNTDDTAFFGGWNY
eukprot:3313243-Ditylum_brightwellii.AAC.1